MCVYKWGACKKLKKKSENNTEDLIEEEKKGQGERKGGERERQTE